MSWYSLQGKESQEGWKAVQWWNIFSRETYSQRSQVRWVHSSGTLAVSVLHLWLILITCSKPASCNQILTVRCLIKKGVHTCRGLFLYFALFPKVVFISFFFRPQTLCLESGEVSETDHRCTLACVSPLTPVIGFRVPAPHANNCAQQFCIVARRSAEIFNVKLARCRVWDFELWHVEVKQEPGQNQGSFIECFCSLQYMAVGGETRAPCSTGERERLH